MNDEIKDEIDEIQDEIKIEESLDFKLSLDRITLFAVFNPAGNKIEKLSIEMVYQRLEVLEIACLLINKYAIFDLIHRYKRATEKFILEIGQRQDATCGITISDDSLTAYLTLTPNFGGKAITPENIQKLLQINRVVFGVISTEKMEAILAIGEGTDFVIAEGVEPIAGINTQFQDLTPQRHERKPFIDEKGNVDFRELGDIIMVHKDDILIQRIPPTIGRTGRDILGNILEPIEGLDIPFAKDLSGVHLNPEDESQLISSISGQPILLSNGMVVSPILTVDDVNLLSGNIRFDGSVVVLGNVEVDMTVYAFADITIGGDVMNAKIECKGNLKIRGGVTGNSELIVGGDIQIKEGIQKYTEKTDKKLNPATSKEVEPVIVEAPSLKKIIARGSVSVDFVENCSIEAGIDIVINKYAINSELMATNKIVIGTGGGGYDQQSSIIGGMTWAMLLVKAITIGSSSGVKTKVQVGSNPHIQHRLMQIKNTLLHLSDEQQKIDKVLEWLINNPEKNNTGTAEKLQHTRSRLELDTNIYLAELNELKSHIKVITNAKIISERSIYTGTEIKVSRSLWAAHENHNRRLTFREKERKIVLSHK